MPNPKCLHCGKTVLRRADERLAKYKARCFCSRICYRNALRKMTKAVPPRRG